MLNLVLGLSGSGKSAWMMQELKARAEKGQHSILLVPEQFTSSTEGALYHNLGDSLSGFVESYSFSSLAEALLQRYGGAAVPTLTDAGRTILVRRAVEQLADKITYYGRQRRSTAFCEKAAQTIEELKSAGVTPQKLEEYARAEDADTIKLQELALIYGTYEALLANTAMDPGDRVEQAARVLQPDFFAGRTVFVDEFDTFNASKRAIMEAMLSCADVTVCLCADDAVERDGGVGTFSGAKRVAAQLQAMATRAGLPCHTQTRATDYRHSETPALAELNLLLADPGYTPEHTVDADNPAIVQYQADSCQDEAKAVALHIAALARKGVPYRRMAIICRETSAYLSPLRYELRLAGIPLFCDEATTPENTAPARAVRAALGLLRGGLNSNAVMQLLKTGLVDLPAAQQCALENYVYTWPLHAEDWRSEFTRSPAGYGGGGDEAENRQTLADAEAARQFLTQRIEKFRTEAAGADVTGLAKAIYAFLQALGAEKTRTRLADALRSRGDYPAAEEVLRGWNVVCGLLDEMVRLLSGEGDLVLDPAAYDELFTLLLRTTDMGHIPQSLDSVLLTTAGRMRLPQTDACFVIGLAEGEFPSTPGDSGLLTHADRDAMIAQNADLPDCFENRVIREKVCFYKALTAAGKFLWLSWPGGAAGKEASTALKPVLDLLQPPEVSHNHIDLAPTPAAALDMLGDLWQQDAPRSAAVEKALLALENTPNAAPGFASVRRAATGLAGKVEDLAALEKVLGRSLHISPTRLEAYENCPFGYFMQFVLKAKPRPKAELAPNISGTLTHWVLEQALRRHGAEFVQMSEEELAQMTAQLCEEYVQTELPGTGVRMDYLVSRIRRNLVRLLLFIQGDMKQSGFQPVAYELRIGQGADPEAPDAPVVPPVELTDDAGHTIRVIGTVDRVDAMRRGENTFLRVVDYKTGPKEFELKEVYCGRDCQMLLYLFTLVRNGGNLYPGAAPAGVEYLKADPSPEILSRGAAQQTQQTTQGYELEGLLLDDETVYGKMDTTGTGRYLPLKIDGKTGKVSRYSADRLADPEKLKRIQDHIDELLRQMARQLYGGEIAATPLCLKSKNSPCKWCDYKSVCGHQDGEDERCPEIPAKPFDPPKQEEAQETAETDKAEETAQPKGDDHL